MKKKIVSLLLAAVCFGSVFPGTVFAEEPAETETVYTLGEKELTVADVIAFSNMNRVLQWADFTDYSGEILHLKNKLWETEWQFAVADGEDGLMLRICGSTDKFPAHIYLSDSSKRQIDIRSDDVQSFLNKGAGEDSLTVSEEVKEHFRVYETYSDEFTEPERRLVQDFKSIMRYYNVPLRGAFTEFDNIDDVLASAYVLKKYYVVEYEDGSVKSYNEHFQEMKSNSYTIRNGEQVALPYLTIPENAWNAFYNSDFVKTYIAPDAQVENVYWLSGESSMMGTAIYYRTSVGDYVYYYYHTIGETLFPVSDFCAYQQAIKDENAKYPESGGGINIADVWDLTDYRLKANISGIMGDVNNDGAFNISDVVLLQKWLLAVPDTHLANWKAADFCEDNKLDVFDLTLMKRALIYDSIAQSTTDLKTQFPEYYGLPTTKGLEVYLWQDTEGGYKCGLLMGTNRNKSDEEIIDLTHNGATVEQMKEILSSYNIDKNMITLILVQISETSYEIVGSDLANVEKLFWGNNNIAEPTSQQVATQDVLDRTSFVSKIDEIKSMYSAEEIISYIDYCGGPNIITFLYALDERYPIEYFVRPVGSAPYCVYKVDNGDKLFVFFNENEESLRDVTYFFLKKEYLTQESFAGISSGSTLADVEAIDQGTQFIDSVNAYSLSKGFTLHMVEGGFIKITYEGGGFNYRSSKLENSSDFIVKEVSFVPNGEAIDIPRIFGDGPVHYTIAEYD